LFVELLLKGIFLKPDDYVTNICVLNICAWTFVFD